MLYFRFENPGRSHIPPNHIPQLLHSPPSIEIWHKKGKMWRKKVWITQHWFSFNLKISVNPVSQAIFCETKYCVFAENFFIPVLQTTVWMILDNHSHLTFMFYTNNSAPSKVWLFHSVFEGISQQLVACHPLLLGGLLRL